MAKSLLFGSILILLMLPATGMAQDTLSPLARSIQDDLSLLDSRTTARDNDRLESDRIQRTSRERGRAARLIEPIRLRSAQDISLSSDLDATQQDLRTLKTREPNAGSTPLLERQYDRISRDAGRAGLYQPSRNPAALYAR